MRLFLSDSFFDKLIELPKTVQQNVRTFQKKFRENSQSSSIHLEKITQFRDSSLRSARVDGAYRAILGSLGDDNYMLLYVDKHDLAYQWAQNKKFQWNEHTQTCQIMQLDFNSPETVPDAQVEDNVDGIFASISDDQLLKIGVPEELLALARSIKDLDDLGQAEKNFPQDAFENLFAIMDGEDVQSIITEIEEGKVKNGEDSLLSNNNKRRFVEITNDEYLAQILDEGMEKWQLFLHKGSYGEP
jgi:mRNA-degrading endonuclease RelE of RelBE toxin-antitoxin system